MTYTTPYPRRCVCGNPSYSTSAHLAHLARCPVAQVTPVPAPALPEGKVVVGVDLAAGSEETIVVAVQAPPVMGGESPILHLFGQHFIEASFSNTSGEPIPSPLPPREFSVVSGGSYVSPAQHPGEVIPPFTLPESSTVPWPVTREELEKLPGIRFLPYQPTLPIPETRQAEASVPAPEDRHSDCSAEERIRKAAHELRNGWGNGNINVTRVLDILEREER